MSIKLQLQAIHNVAKFYFSAINIFILFITFSPDTLALPDTNTIEVATSAIDSKTTLMAKIDAATAPLHTSILLLSLVVICFGFYEIYRIRNEKRNINKALEDNKSDLEATLDAIPDLLFELGLDGKYYAVKYPNSNLLAAPHEVLIGKTVYEVLNHTAAEVIMSALLEASQTGHSHGKQFELDVPKGKRWFELSVSSKHPTENENLRFIVLSRDISERKLAENNLLQSERLSRAVIDASPVPQALNDNLGNITFLNAAFINTIGYTLEDIPKLNDWWNLAYPDPIYQKKIIAEWQNNLNDAVLNHQPFKPIEVKVHCKDASIRTFICSATDLAGSFDNTYLVTLYDITDRKLTLEKLLSIQSELKDSHNRYRDLYEFAPIGYLSLDNQGLITEVNWKVTTLFGLSKSEIFQIEFGSLVADENKALWHSTFTNLEQLVEGEELSFDLRLSHSSGSEFTASINCLRMEDEENLPMLRLTLVDITQVKEIEDALKKREGYYRAVLDNFPFMVWLKDKDSRLLAVNKVYAQACGKASPDLVLGKTDLDLFPKHLAEGYLAEDKAVLNSGIAKNTEEQIEFAGELTWFETYKSPIVIDGEIIGTVGFARDISRRRETEKRIDKLLASQTALLENHLVGIVTARDRSLLWANLAFEEMLGYSKDELIGMSTRKFYANEADYLSVGKSYAEIALKGIVRKQFPFVRKDGAIIWLNMSGTLLNHESGESIWIFVDVTELRKAEVQAAESHNLLKTVIDTAPMRIFWKDNDLKYLGCNIAFAKDAGKNSPEEVVGKDDFEMGWADQADLYRSADEAVIKSGVAKLFFDEPQTTPDGKTVWLRTSKIPLKNNDHHIIGVLGIYEDITEKKYAEIELRIAATAFESQEGIFITDSNRNILRVNSAFSIITGYGAEDVMGKNPRILSSGLHTNEFYESMWKEITTNSTWKGEIWNKRKNGEIYLEFLTINTVKSEDGVITNYVATLSDITQSKISADEIEKMAFYDALTGLPNRRLFIDRLSHALASSKRTQHRGAVLFIDLDHFKNLNDTMGHDVGDLLLKEVGSRLKACVREGDTVSRLGGDEYVVMLEELNTDMNEAARQTEAIANNMLLALNKPYLLANHEHNTTASIGITIFGNHSTSEEDLLKHADIAMYQAKKAGRNTLRFFDPQMQNAIDARAALENDLRKAIELNQLQLHYQVQVDFLNHPIGAEGLIRWIHPNRGLISPFDFIPIAEETGLILQIGQWVIDTACAQLKAWEENERTKDLTIAVNVSAKQFRQPNFVKIVKTAINLHGADPKHLKLELTESLLLDNIEETIATMNKLRDMGITFSLDDFGTGYSSLQYLKRLPLYQLKIDQSFVHDIAKDNNDQEIIRTIIAMAHTLNLNVIAEGVETLEQKQTLLSNGCVHFQGYLFGKPLPIDKFEVNLENI